VNRALQLAEEGVVKQLSNPIQMEMMEQQLVTGQILLIGGL
jgi:hypothetical protein